MPGQDRTGPYGEGPITGRGMGLCRRQACGFRRGIGRGFNMGRRRFYSDSELTLSKDQEKKILEAELAALVAEKSEVEKRLKGLD